MDVTCPACNTRYEFDEALVSTKGTTVKCTNCGHQFKVYRPEGAAGLDGWAVRTTDGRELRFKAMRELQAAITTSKVCREDVLIPGDGGEPRRLGRIEELQSFFSVGEESVPTTRRRRDTPTSHHDSYGEQELVKTKVRGSGTTEESVTRSHPAPVDRDGEPLPARTGKTLRPPRSDSGRLKRGQGPPPEPKTLPRAEGLPPDVRERFDSELSGDDLAPVPPRGDRRRSTKRGRQAPELPPDRPTEVRRNGPHASRHGQLDAVDAFNRAVRAEIGPSSIEETNVVEQPDEVVYDDVTHPRGRPRLPSAPEEMLRGTDDDTMGDPEAAEAIVAAAIGPKGGPKAAVPASSQRPSIEPASEGERLSAELRMSEAPETPTPSAGRPSVLRRSEVHSDPRFSGYTPRGKRPGLARWVVGIIGVGVIAVAGFTLVNRFRPGTEQLPTAAASDSRVDKFLQEGETRLAEGDIEGAKDHFNKASGVTEADPRVWRALARTSVVRADLVWLELQVLDEDAEGRAGLQQRLVRATQNARAAADRAKELAPDDPLTVSVQIDVLRLEGKPLEARKLAPKVDGAGPDADRARALLDLMEEKPGYSSVIDRLRSAARSERKLGRAQALLVFALWRADKKDIARQELETLATSNPTHVMVIPLRAMLDGKKVAASEDEEPDKEPQNGAKPQPSPVDPASAPRPRPAGGHFEFDKEPVHPIPKPPEPVPDPTPEPQPDTPDPAPAPAPAPGPAPSPPPIDTSDLPE